MLDEKSEETQKKDTKNPLAKELYKKAGTLFESNKFDEAIGLYTQAINEDSKYSSAYFNRALSYAILSRYEEATRDAETVMDIEPDSYDAPYVMGIIAEYQQDYEGAKEWYQKALKLNPKYEQAKSRLEQLKSKAITHPEVSEAGKREAEETQIQEGQIRKVRYHKSKMTFKDVVGMEDQKKLIYENIILAIKKPELLKAYGKKLGLGVLFYGPPGNGKCLAGDSKVLLPDGRYLPIKEVVERKEPYVLTLTRLHKLAVRKVSGWWKLEGKPMLRITTKRGRVLECTPEHPFLTRTGWKDASTFEEGDMIGVPRHTSVFGNGVMRECEVKLLAYLIAEGGLTQGSPKFTNADPEILSDYIAATQQFFDDTLHINTQVGNGNVINLQTAGRYLHAQGPQGRSSMQKFLDLHGLSFTSSYDKKIPQVVFTLQKHLISLFLNRLFSGDGWFEDKEVNGERYGAKRHRVIGYASNSEVLIRQVQHLLIRFGILSWIRHKNTDCWELIISKSRDIDIFVDEIGFFGTKATYLFKKKNACSKIKKKGGNRVVYESIKNIKHIPAPDYVYDLTIDDTHNFLAEDFFVHNTYLVNAIAGETQSNVIIARINEIVDMYAGNTEKNMHAIFEQARKATPCIIFFDELDALGMKRDSGGGGGESQSYMRMAVNQFLQEMDGVEANPEGIFVIGATNQPWDIDPALKRSKRFGEAIYIPPPGYWTRKGAFKYNTRKMPLAGIGFGRLARAAMGFSQADIEEICDKAALIPAAEEDRTGRRRKINMGDFLRMIRTHGNTLDEWYAMIKKEIISKREVQIVDGKRQEIVKEGKLSPEEKSRYKKMVKDVKRNTNPVYIYIKKFVRAFSLYLF